MLLALANLVALLVLRRLLDPGDLLLLLHGLPGGLHAHLGLPAVALGRRGSSGGSESEPADGGRRRAEGGGRRVEGGGLTLYLAR